MRVFVAGATGVLGRRIVHQLVRRDHAVVALVRNDAGENAVRSLGAESRRADLFDADSIAEAAAGCEVVVRAATAIPVKVRPKPADWAMNDRIRRDGTRALIAAAARVRAHAYIQEGVVWAVRAPGGGPFDEDAPPAADPVLASAVDSERIARAAGEEPGVVAMTLRCGGFYSADGWHTRILAQSLSRGWPVLVGRGDPVWSLLHPDDAARAFVAAAEAPRTGVWHIVDDRPVRVSEYLRALAAKLDAHPPRRMPPWLARLVMGPYIARVLSTSFETSNARFRRDFGWRPSYPTYAEGLESILSEWRAEGFPRRRA